MKARCYANESRLATIEQLLEPETVKAVYKTLHNKAPLYTALQKAWKRINQLAQSLNRSGAKSISKPCLYA